MLLSSSTKSRWSSLVPVVVQIEFASGPLPPPLPPTVTIRGGRKCDGKDIPIALPFLLFIPLFPHKLLLLLLLLLLLNDPRVF